MATGYEVLSITNFRSVGNMPASSGRVRPGLIFRSGDLADLSADDARHLQGLGISLICDLRSERERHSRVSRIPEFWTVKTCTYDLMSPTSRKLLDIIRSATVDSQDMVDYLRQRNHDFATLLAPEFGRLLADIATMPPASSALIHCAAGKDRTGFAVALLQLALGVSEDDVLTEYLATRHFLDAALLTKREIEAFERDGIGSIDPASYQPITEVRREYIEAALVHIRRAGIGTFLRERAQVPAAIVEQLRTRLLEPRP